VQGVQGLFHFPRACARGTKPTPHKRTHARIYTLHTLHTLHIVDSYTFFTHATLHRCLHTLHRPHARTPDSPIYSFERKKVEETAQPPAPQATRTIRCTPDNARDMQLAVKNWPELHALVQSLQAQDLFPGLRGLSITLTGPQQYVDRGLAALLPENAPKRD
jgi:hypothetical protein